ncbi:MAG: LEA type 2 family protein [Pseudomonadales bacterium]|nr:LEA type 2 family protein [Pseudomonadales bacterium]
MRPLHAVLLVGAVLVLQACAGLGPQYEAPTVTLNSLRAIPSGGALPSFEIGLHVVNPNSKALKLRGVVYTISLEGHEIIKGAGNNLPVIEAYGEDDVTLTASANLLSGLGLITDLLNRGRDSVSYEFEARLDVGALWPDIRVSDSGTINLRTSTGR